MIELNLSEPKHQKSLVIGMHSFVILCIVGFQTMIIIGVGSSVTWRGCLNFVFQIIAYFLCQYWVIPKVFDKRSKINFVSRILFLVFTYIIIRGLLAFSAKSGKGYWDFILSFDQLVYASLQLALVLGLSFFMGLLRRHEMLRQEYFKAIRTALQTEAEKLRIENIVTQMRLSPHLLFNTLSYIKTKAEILIPEIAKAVDLLSGILRHAMIDVLIVEKVSLKNEIERVKDLVELQYQLAPGKVFINYAEEYDGGEENAMIPPYILLTLAENVFRYGVVSDGDYPAFIKIKHTGKHFMFSTTNYKKLDPHTGTGMGIKSVGSTLGYYYPGRHILDIKDADEDFLLTLNIEL